MAAAIEERMREAPEESISDAVKDAAVKALSKASAEVDRTMVRRFPWRVGLLLSVAAGSEGRWWLSFR